MISCWREASLQGNRIEVFCGEKTPNPSPPHKGEGTLPHATLLASNLGSLRRSSPTKPR